jgi:putative ABC transport system substrate-binding protein
MRRREFITLLGGATAAWPLAARAQQAAMPVVGFIQSETLDLNGHQVVAFRRGLSEAGYEVGRNAVIEYRSAEGRDDRLPALVVDLISRQPSVIVGNTPSALAAKRATATIPIVFTSGADPVALGLVASLNRPGGNVTGVSFLASKLEAKRLGLLRELVPSTTLIACLIDPKYAAADSQVQDLHEAARAVGLKVEVENASTERDIERAFETLASKNVGALLVGAAPLFNRRRDEIVALAARHALPAIYEWREFAEAGGLVAYGASLPDAYRQAGDYAGRVLKGAKPADLPVLQPTKFELVLNVKTARALGLTPSPGLLAIADEVIE